MHRRRIDGIWRSLGYGQVLEISGRSLTVYSQVAGHILESTDERASRSRARFEFEILPFDFQSTFEMALAGDMLALFELNSGREILFERLDGLPPRDSRTSDPEINLEYFLSLFADLYPAFEDQDVGWSAVTSRLRLKASRGLDENGLFALFREAMDELGRDGHVDIAGPLDSAMHPAAITFPQ